jgi:nucleoside 2-deoxyribosyltransferase|tara:strand:- start:5082 stop:5552 length:471 start_codon:yes stop_codon:yes gene_type:complete
MSLRKTVYLAGPIAECDDKEANEWRDWVTSRLPYGIIGISPLRCEPLKEGMRYTDPGATEKMWSDPRAIATKNWLDTESCDLVLAYLPQELNERRPSYGTVIEIGWAIGLRKPLVVVSDDEYLMEHPLIQHNASWRLDNLEDAVEVITGLFGDYVQ